LHDYAAAPPWRIPCEGLPHDGEAGLLRDICAQAVAKGVFGALARHTHLWDDASPKGFLNTLRCWLVTLMMKIGQAERTDGTPIVVTRPGRVLILLATGIPRTIGL
jgi:hypothetical protein